MITGKIQKTLATVAWVLITFVCLGALGAGHLFIGIPLLVFVVIFAMQIIQMPPKGIKGTVKAINPDLDTVVYGWYIPFLIKHWKLVVIAFVVVAVAGPLLIQFFPEK